MCEGLLEACKVAIFGCRRLRVGQGHVDLGSHRCAQVVGRVPGVLKMTRKEKDKEKEKAMFGEQGKATDVVATLEFEPPTHVRWSRYDASGKTSFITAFYCSPAGAVTASMTHSYPQSITATTVVSCTAAGLFAAPGICSKPFREVCGVPC